ncbi:MAG: ParB N-terminal domain-containing protein [Planctomycetes bacterium]|nr:ParB N-terminal domain-containing protein [Planctomycetota bacterium]
MKSPRIDAILEVRVLPIEQLQPAPYNPRQRLKVTDPAYRKLETSLREFGLVEPLIWNETSGHIVGGHARLRILRKMGVKEVPVSVVHLDEAREKALNVILNNHEAQGRFDTAKLADLLTELEDLPELDMTGFDAKTLSNLRMEPDESADEEETAENTVTVSLEMDAETYEELASELNELIGRFDLASHVKRT